MAKEKNEKKIEEENQLIKDGKYEEGLIEEKKDKLLPNGGYPMHTFEDLKALYSLYIHYEPDRQMIEDAYHFVEKQHAGIVRKSGEPYIHHLIEVAYIVASLQGGPVTITAALLHDVVEDTDTSVNDIKLMFGEETARIVDSLTKIQRLKLSKRKAEDFEAEDHRKIFLGMAKDVRVIIIKLADRLHNLRTIEALKPERQHAIAKETLEVFAPIAHRLGIYRVESELEDLSLKIEKPEEYKNISNLLNERINNRMSALNQLRKKISDILLKAGFKFEVEARVKSIYSIYKKMYIHNHQFENIYDVLALRIITESELNCYEILGLIHQNFSPIPGRFKDYIAMPKPNMYQSLHTSVIDGNSNIFEVQIRTKEMDEIAESGVAAHWRYKEGTHYNAKQEQKEIEEKLHWFRDFISISKDKDISKSEDANLYLDVLSKDIFEANVYVFTPKGKVIDLPTGSTPLDLAYKIHSKIGESAVGALINGNLVPLNTQLKTGDICEIKTSKNAPGPNEEWLNICKTNSAKSKIKKYLLKKNSDLVRDDKISRGKSILFDYFKDRGYNEKEAISLINTDKLLKNYQLKDLDELYIGIAAHNPTPGQIGSFLGIKKKNDLYLSKKENFDDDKCPVTIENGKGIKITLGNCCTPIPGDDIVGYVTKGFGVTVHRRDCPNVSKDRARLIDVHWKDNIKDGSFPLDLQLECIDRNNLIADILSVLAANKIKCTEISAKIHPNNFAATITCQIYVANLNEFMRISQLLKSIKDIYEIKRVIH